MKDRANEKLTPEERIVKRNVAIENWFESWGVTFGFAAGVTFFAILLLILTNGRFFNWSLIIDPLLASYLGTFINGFMGTLASLGAVALLFATYRSQKRELMETRQAMQKQAEVMNIQLESSEQQAFENILFKLLEYIDSYLNTDFIPMPLTEKVSRLFLLKEINKYCSATDRKTTSHWIAETYGCPLSYDEINTDFVNKHIPNDDFHADLRDQGNSYFRIAHRKEDIRRELYAYFSLLEQTSKHVFENAKENKIQEYLELVFATRSLEEHLVLMSYMCTSLYDKGYPYMLGYWLQTAGKGDNYLYPAISTKIRSELSS